ncbi:MAG: zinc ribbon domain-containing protein, partial [Ktedonobacterales bacterium]
MDTLAQCSRCGRDLPTGARFCPTCGAEVREGRQRLATGLLPTQRKLQNPRHYLEDMQLWALDERYGRLQKPSRRPVQLTSAPMYWMWPVISPDSRTIFAT